MLKHLSTAVDEEYTSFLLIRWTLWVLVRDSLASQASMVCSSTLTMHCMQYNYTVIALLVLCEW